MVETALSGSRGAGGSAEVPESSSFGRCVFSYFGCVVAVLLAELLGEHF